jgi:hypothetical protein
MIGYRVLADMRKAVGNYVKAVGREPNTAYLGKEEVRALEEVLVVLGGYKGDPSGEEMVMGMRMFRVDAQNHLSVVCAYGVISP